MAARVLALEGLRSGFGVFGFEVSRVANAQTFTNNAFTKATFDTKVRDDDDAFVLATGIYTAKVAGWHLFVGNLTVSGIDNAERAILGYYLNNGSAPVRQGGTQFSSTTDQDIAAHSILPTYLEVGDTIDVRINHDEGADRAQVVEASGAFNWLTGLRFGAAVAAEVV